MLISLLSMVFLLGCQVPQEVPAVEESSSEEDVISEDLEELEELDQLLQDFDKEIDLDELEVIE